MAKRDRSLVAEAVRISEELLAKESHGVAQAINGYKMRGDTD